MSRKMRANLLLFFTAMIWGAAFAAQDVAADTLQPMSFNGVRMALAALALLPTVWWMDRRSARTGDGWKTMTSAQRRTLLTGGVCCGVMLAAGSVLQQAGLSLGAGAGKAGFITALYIVLVPLLGLLGGRRIGRLLWLAVALSVAGLYLLCMKGGFSVELSDLVLMLCALAYSGHILVVDHFSRRTDCVKMSCIQFAVTSLLCLAGAFLFESPTWEAIRLCAVPLLYAGVMSAGLGYTFQILAQRDAEPAVASLLMSLESVFAVLAGWILLGDVLSVRELAGCCLMAGGIVLAQLPQKTH